MTCSAGNAFPSPYNRLQAMAVPTRLEAQKESQDQAVQSTSNVESWVAVLQESYEAGEFAGENAIESWKTRMKDKKARQKVVVVLRNSCRAFPPMHVWAVSDLVDRGVSDAWVGRPARMVMKLTNAQKMYPGCHSYSSRTTQYLGSVSSCQMSFRWQGLHCHVIVQIGMEIIGLLQ
jgi:hypothetical protein